MDKIRLWPSVLAIVLMIVAFISALGLLVLAMVVIMQARNDITLLPDAIILYYCSKVLFRNAKSLMGLIDKEQKRS